MTANRKLYISEQARAGLQALAQAMGAGWTVETLVEHAGIAADGLKDAGDLDYVAGVVRNFLAEDEAVIIARTGDPYGRFYAGHDEYSVTWVSNIRDARPGILAEVRKRDQDAFEYIPGRWPDESADRGDEGVEPTREERISRLGAADRMGVLNATTYADLDDYLDAMEAKSK